MQFSFMENGKYYVCNEEVGLHSHKLEFCEHRELRAGEKVILRSDNYMELSTSEEE